jgi:hypothetical protein
LLLFGNYRPLGRGFFVRKVLGLLLLGVGAFLLVIAVLGRFWAPGMAERTPLDIDTATRLSGSAQKLNLTTGALDDLPVKAISRTRVDSGRSDDDVVVFVSTTCLVVDQGDVPDCVDAEDPQKRLVTASSDVFATDRHTATAVNTRKYLTADAEPHQGLVNKFPFGSEKKTYRFWDGLLGTTVPATYAGTSTLDGLKTYEYKVDVPSTDAEVVEGTQGTYATRKSIFVEPRTGSIIKQTQHEVRKLASGQTILDLDIAYTPQTVKAAADDAEANVQSLRLLTGIIPLVGLVLGLVLVVAGLLVVRRSGRRRAGSHAVRTRRGRATRVPAAE